ncbi:MAG: HEAT repeat domain-containing protein [Chloroherpetonaceae bacterium]|nr:HEAT repeat domain-containing protein [Chloroherpetonaceae bacterium]
MTNEQSGSNRAHTGLTRERLRELYLAILLNEASIEENRLWQSAIEKPETASLAQSIKEELDSLTGFLTNEFSRPLSEGETALLEKAQSKLSVSLKNTGSPERSRLKNNSFFAKLYNPFLNLLASFDTENEHQDHENEQARFGMPALALTGVVMLILGGFIGYSTFAVASFFRGELPVSQSAAVPITDKEELANIRFSFSENETDPIRVQYDLITHVETKGTLNQSRIKELLLYAVNKERNPGTRLDALSELQKIPSIFNDQDIKEALIKALKSDQNDGVRNQALALLLEYQPDSEIKMALLYSLMNDRNAGIRIASLNSLLSVGLTGEKFDEEVLASLKKKIQEDENKYIRYRANALFDEAPPEIEEKK